MSRHPGRGFIVLLLLVLAAVVLYMCAGNVPRPPEPATDESNVLGASTPEGEIADIAAPDEDADPIPTEPDQSVPPQTELAPPRMAPRRSPDAHPPYYGTQTLHVIVQDRDGRRIAGASVQVCEVRLWDGRNYSTGGKRATTDETGLAVFPNLGATSAVVEATALEYTTERVRVTMQSEGVTEGTVTLSAGAVVIGRIVAPTGHTLASPLDIFMSWSGRQRSDPYQPPFPREATVDGAPITAWTFRIGGISAGSTRLAVQAHGFADYLSDALVLMVGETQTLGDIVLVPFTPSRNSLLIVADDARGQRLPGILVWFDHWSWHLEQTQSLRTLTVTNADGELLIEGVEPGTHWLRARLAGFADTVIENIEVPPDLEEPMRIHVRMEPGGVVQGEAYREDGTPWEGLQVSLHAGSTQRTLWVLATAADGTFAFPAIGSGVYFVRIQRSCEAILNPPNTFELSSGGMQYVRIQEQIATYLTGRVTLPDGSPYGHRPVKLAQLGSTNNGPLRPGETQATTTTNDDGEYRLPCPGIFGVFAVSVQDDTGRWHDFYVQLVNRPVVRDCVMFFPEDTGSSARIAGVVRDHATRAPIANAEVSLFSVYSAGQTTESFFLRVTTEPDGNSEFFDVPPGGYQLITEADGYMWERQRVTLPIGAAVADIVMWPPGRLLFRVTLAVAGDASEHVRITATTVNGSNTGGGGYGETGEVVEVDILHAGDEYEVTVQVGEHPPVVLRATAIASGETMDPIDVVVRS